MFAIATFWVAIKKRVFDFFSGLISLLISLFHVLKSDRVINKVRHYYHLYPFFTQITFNNPLKDCFFYNKYPVTIQTHNLKTVLIGI